MRPLARPSPARTVPSALAPDTSARTTLVPIVMTRRAGEGRASGRIACGASLRVVDAILTGVHQPGESHYELLRAFANDRVLGNVRAAVEERGYRPHEFGDSLLIERQGDPGVL